MNAGLVAACALALVAATAGALLAMGRSPICPCGFVELWHGQAASAKTSQQLADPYTFTHVIHGALFYGFAWLIGLARRRPLPVGAGFLLATGLECVWEIIENTPAVIERYRTATIALGYDGDSILNSVGDIAAMMAGYAAAARLPVAATVAAVIVTEAALGYLIRDNLALNVLMLLYPIEAIRAWQRGG